MSDELIQRLSRLTPAGKLPDRDALMYQAGRASVPSAAPWQRAVALLALTQTLTLALWWVCPLRSPPPTASLVVPAPVESTPQPTANLLRWSELSTPEPVVD
ncbi:MAG: hypothetical protein SNJ75_18345, partial [Gemmataceae bacterium]